MHILNKVNIWTKFIIKCLPLFYLHLKFLWSHRTWTTKTISQCSPKRELFKAHRFFQVNGPVYTHIVLYDSYRKWTSHYSFISHSHKNNHVIERLKFKESLWEYFYPHLSFLFYNGILAREVFLYIKRITQKRQSKDRLPLGFVYLRHRGPAYSWPNLQIKKKNFK